MDFGTGSTSSSFPLTTFGYTYDVFLSFRGEDTRNNFVGHLYTTLDNKGIYTFKDDEKLQRGTIIKSELFKAIEESRFAVVILSTDYASSSWCLIELAKIIECMEKTGITVLPVFHCVDPSDVRNLRGVFEEAFAEHSVRFEDKIDEVNNWRDALVKVADIAGWDLRHRSESPVIEEIVRKIYGQLNSIYSNVHVDCVGLDSRVTEIKNSYLGIGLEDVRFIGIWGMGGMGKTTLARVLHQRIHYHFDASSFIGNVREESCKNGLISLQKQLLDDILIESNIQIRDIPWGINMIKDRLCKKKVLITLDDVDQLDQLNALAGKRDWFGQGSRIIITTRDKHLLIRHGMTIAEIYNIKKLEENEALKLFSREVFKKDYPPKDFMKMSQNVIHYADGLPLALKVLGADLMKREPVDWKGILDNLKEDPPSQLKGVFEISFNGLYSKQKNVFLDIACFFNGFNKDWVANILQTSIEIDVLVEKSLIEVSRFGNLWIHDTLQDFGRGIVHRESPNEHGQRSRLWLSDDIFHVLKHNTGTEKVKGIFLSSSFIEEIEVHLNAKVFSKMINLRLLRIDHVHLPRGLDYLSNELCFMNWANYPLKSLPESFHPNKLIELIMHTSSLKQLWNGIKSSKMLKHINLSYSKDLIKIPDLTEVPNLEKLILKGCRSLSKIHPSLGYLEKLILLDLDGCVCLKSLPCKINSECLVIDLNGCLRLKNFPKIVGNMSHLPCLNLDGTAIKGLPLSIKYLTDLTLLSLRDCKSLLSLPDSICCLTSLTTLTLSGCSRLKKLPMNLGNLVCLENLAVIGIAISELPSSVEHLTRLTSLNLSDCKDLLSLPDTICNMTYLKELNLSGCSRLNKLPMNLGNLVCLEDLGVIGITISELPSSVEHLTRLTSLNLSDCEDLLSLPDTICSMTYLKELNLSDCSRLNKLPTNLGNLVCLEDLGVIGIAISELPSLVEHLTRLTSLNLSDCEDLLSLPDTICSMTYLKELNLSGCSRLNKLPTNLGNLVCLEDLGVIGIAISELPSSVEHLTRLTSLNLSDCEDLLSLPDTICSMTYLKELNLSGCSRLNKLPTNLGNLVCLEDLGVIEIAISELPSSVEHLTRLTSLNLSDCEDLLSLPDTICSMTYLKELNLSGCSRLNKLPTNLGNLVCLEDLGVIGIAISELPSSVEHLTRLTSLNLSDCKDLLSLPDTICSMTYLKELNLSGCSRLDRLPKNLGNLTGLKELDVNKTAIRELPSSLEHLSNLTSLNLSNCKELLSIPNAICTMTNIKTLTLSGLLKLEDLPENIGNLIDLKNMTNIKTLTLSGLSKLEDLPENIGNLIGLKKLEIIGTAVREPPSSIFLIKNLEVLRFHGCEGTLSTRSPNPVRLELPSLSCLRSLVELELRDCNLRAVPHDIDSLHLLEKLNLSKNNFVCLPESIVRLSKLKDIYIENCTSLRSLPQVPLSTLSIWANGCTSLETLPNQLKQEIFFEANVYLLNCFKLADNQGFSDKFLTLLSCYFQELCYNDFSGTNRYDLVVPGRNFPKWFSHQSLGNSVALQVPPNFVEKCLAIGMCASFKHLPSGLGGLFDRGSHDRTRHRFYCSIAFYPKGELDRSTAFYRKSISFPFPKNFGQVESTHLWLIYLRREFFHEIEDCVGSKGLHGGNGFVLQIKFKTEGTGLTVNKCGAHFVFKQDIEDLSKTNEMDFFFNDHHLNSKVPVDGTSRVEPSHDGNYDGAGPNGEGSSNELRGESSNDGAGPSGESISNGMTGTKRIRCPNRMPRLGKWFGNFWR